MGFGISHTATTGNACDGTVLIAPGLPSKTGENRTKTGNGRNPGLQHVNSQGTRTHSPHLRFVRARSQPAASPEAMTNADATYSHFTSPRRPAAHAARANAF